MDGHGGDRVSEQLHFESAGFQEGAGSAARTDVRPGPTWRAWVLSIVAAIVLSVAATLILGGSFRLPAASNAAAGGCGADGACCPPRSEAGR